MNSKKVKEIIKFKVEKNLQNKWFIILNIITLIGIILATNAGNVTKFMENNNINLTQEKSYKIQILDNENIFYDDFQSENVDNSNITIEKVSENPYSEENIPDEDTIFIEVNKDDEQIIKAKIITKGGIAVDLYDNIYNSLNTCRSKIFAEENGITQADLNKLSEDVTIERVKLGLNEDNADTKQIIQYISIVVLYLVLIMVLSNIANEVVNEKVSKSTEYVLTSISAKEYLLSKVLSATLTVGIQIMYTIIYYFIGNLISSIIGSESIETISVTGGITNNFEILGYIALVIIYLISHIFVISMFQAVLSSKANTVNEAGNTTIISIIPVAVAYMIGITVISAHSITPIWVYVLSVMPIFSMFFVPSMMIIGQAKAIQIIISLIVLIFTAIFGLDICSKKFKDGILDYNTKKKKKNNKKETDLKETQEIELKKKIIQKFAFGIGLSMMIFIMLEIFCSLSSSIIIPKLLENVVSNATILIIENSVVLIIALGLTALFINAYLKNDNLKQEQKKIKFKESLKIIIGSFSLIMIVQIVLGLIYKKLGLDNSVMEEVRNKRRK